MTSAAAPSTSRSSRSRTSTASASSRCMSTNGDTFLGGEDFDRRIIDYVAAEFQKESGVDVRKDPLAVQRLKEAAEKAKVELSSASRPRSTCRTSRPTPRVPKHLTLKLTRAKLESLVEDLVNRTIEPCRIALEGRRPFDQRSRRGDPGRRPDAHAAGAEGGEGLLRQGAAQGRQPGRGGRRRRRDPGRRARGRRQGRAPARRHAAVARHRDPRRRHDAS